MRRPRMRRLVPALLAAMVALAAAASCTPTAVPPWPPGNAVAQITIVSGSDTSLSAGSAQVSANDNGMYQQLVDYWNAYEEPAYGFSVKLDVIPGGATAVHDEMLAAAQTGGEGYDIYNLDSQWVSEFADGGYIRSLQGRVNERNFLPGPLRSAMDASNHLYAVPFTTDAGLLYYRSDLISAAAVRRLRDFQAVIKLAESVVRRHPGVTEGYVGQFANYEGLTVNALEEIWGHDRAAFASDGTITDAAAVRQGLEDLVSAFRRDRPKPDISPTELYYQEQQAFQDFATGKAVFMRNWPIYYEKLAAGGPDAVSVKKDVGFAPLPFPSVLGGQDLAVASSSPNPQQALDVIKFLTSAPAERCLYAVAGFPATMRTAYTAKSLPPGPVGTNRLCGTTQDASAENAKFGQTILAALSTAIARPRTRYYTEFTTLLGSRVWTMLSQASQGDSVNVASVVTNLTADLRAAATGHAP